MQRLARLETGALWRDKFQESLLTRENPIGALWCAGFLGASGGLRCFRGVLCMGEATGAIGKLIISLIATAIITLSVYNSLSYFGADAYLKFPYATEVCAGSLGLITLVLIYGLMMRLKHQL